MLGCWYGSEFPYVEQQRGNEIGNVGAVGRRVSKNSPGNRRGSPHTSSADDVLRSSFHALEIPNVTNGSAPAQCTSAWHIKAVLTCRGDTSIIPLKAGCHTRSRRSEDRGGQRLEEKGVKLLPQVSCHLLGDRLKVCHVFNMHLCKLREFGTDGLIRRKLFVFHRTITHYCLQFEFTRNA